MRNKTEKVIVCLWKLMLTELYVVFNQYKNIIAI